MACTIKYSRLPENDPDGMKWILDEEYTCIVPYLGYEIPIPQFRKSDGATGARDLGAPEKGWRKWWARAIGALSVKFNKITDGLTDGWWGHDEICINGYVMVNGEIRKVSNFTASLCLSLLLWKDGYRVETFTWFFPTLFGGGGQARKNGLFWIKRVKYV